MTHIHRYMIDFNHFFNMLNTVAYC